MYKTKQFTLIFNSLHPKTVQSPLIIFWTSGPFKYFLTRRNLTIENITNESEICQSIFCRIEVNFMKFNMGAILSYFGHLTLFVTVQVILRSNMTITSRAKLFGSMVRTWKYFHTLLLYAYQSLEPFNPILAYQRTTYFALGDLFYDKREDFKTVL